MFDAVSDVIDWFAGLTWNGAGIAASILVVVIMITSILFNVVTARLRAKKRDKLIEFLDEGQGFVLQLRNSITPAIEKVRDWAQRTEDYLEKHVGSGSAARFRTASDEVADKVSPYGGITERMDRLREFLAELSR